MNPRFELSIQGEVTTYTPRADRRKAAREKRIADLRQRTFVCWDGEGADNAARKAQSYVLLGSYNGVQHDYITAKSLTTQRCLEHIIKVGRKNQGSWHVSFAFSYDVNMILKGLTPAQFKYLRDHRRMRIGKTWRLEHIPGKWFSVTKYSQNSKFSVRIYDVFGFYQSSFLTAIHANIADHPAMRDVDIVESGKASRHSFSYSDIDKITEYWKVEQILFHALVNRLREMCYEAGLYIAKWHGPGELAAFLYRSHGIKGHKNETDSGIYNLCRYAYCGGRFERFHIGRYRNVYGLDINSAYPDAISRLPSLRNGKWIHQPRVRLPREFALYRIELNEAEKQLPGPLFRRDWRGNITFPWKLNGWYWGPEVIAMCKHYPLLVTCIKEGWEFEDDGTRPFEFVRETYKQRQVWKAALNGAQMALKLALNSLYGKMAQRAGWERNNRAPTWHQLEWAGWVTSYTRARLFDVMAQIPFDELIAVETDGIYTTCHPDRLSIKDSKELGGWEVTVYDEIIYLQSGVYAKRQGSEWEMKYRGLDKESFEPEDFVNHAKELAGWPASLVHVPYLEEITDDGHVWMTHYTPRPKDLWPKLKGNTTRFIGYENALFRELSNRGPFTLHHCVWETAPHEIDCERGTKRKHRLEDCKACNHFPSQNAYEMPHDTIIVNQTAHWKEFPPRADYGSYPHDIPWLDKDDPDAEYEWRQFQRELDGLINGEKE